jgi:hypothetical protein
LFKTTIRIVDRISFAFQNLKAVMNPVSKQFKVLIILAYFSLVFLLIYWLVNFRPELVEYLPVGGMNYLPEVTSLTGKGGLTDQVMEAAVATSAYQNAINLVTAMLGTIIMMFPLRQLYLSMDIGKPKNLELPTSLLVLPLVVTAIVYIVKFSLPLAFALAGIFAGVRYRTSLKNQTDAYFTFASIGVGLAAGTRSLGIAFVLALVFCLTVVLSHSEPKQPS